MPSALRGRGAKTPRLQCEDAAEESTAGSRTFDQRLVQWLQREWWPTGGQPQRVSLRQGSRQARVTAGQARLLLSRASPQIHRSVQPHAKHLTMF